MAYVTGGASGKKKAPRAAPMMPKRMAKKRGHKSEDAAHQEGRAELKRRGVYQPMTFPSPSYRPRRDQTQANRRKRGGVA